MTAALLGFAGCAKQQEPGFGQGSSVTPPAIDRPANIDVWLIIAIVIGAAVLALTVFMAVRMIREKSADRRAEQAVLAEKRREKEEASKK